MSTGAKILRAGPFRYTTYAASYLDAAGKYAHVPLKEAVISASALSLLYPQGGIRDRGSMIPIQH
jgi:5-methyltetrahydropteroyltriglutamate--homocysteine methyltransferase